MKAEDTEWKFGMNIRRDDLAVYTKGTKRRIYDEDKLLLEYNPFEITIGDVLIETAKRIKDLKELK